MSTRQNLRSWEILLTLLFIVPVSRSEQNIALTGIAQQSSNQDERWTAGKAKDNCVNQDITQNCCVHTAAGVYKQAWWRVDLMQIKTIQYITIYYRSGSGYRFGGYSVYVSNSTDPTPQGILCYKDNSSLSEDVNLNPTHLCPYVAQYVTVYNHREEPKRHDWYSNDAVLELCEVQVLGCPIGKYGNGNCNNYCSESCYRGNCNAITGSCFYCFPGMFGDFCEQPCSANCKITCVKDTGHCIECINGKHGDLCDVDCSDNCKNKSCMKETGYCLECVPGKYGDDCAADCSVNCKDKTCMKNDGTCIECVLGKHGDNCAVNCSDNCKNKNCTRSDGHCIGCNPGKKGELCDTSCSSHCVTCDQASEQCFECIPGKYGDQCTNNCSVNCEANTCTKSNGQCIACNPGKYGPSCSMDCLGQCKDNSCQQSDGTCTDCPVGKHGSFCNISCSESCLNNRCNAESGDCEECAGGLHGGNCSMPCRNCDRCVRDTGYCLSVCSAGYEGNTCQMKVLQTETSDGNTGTIVGVVVGLLLLAVIISTSVFLIRRRRQNSTKKDSFDDISRKKIPRTTHHNYSYEPDDYSAEPVTEQGNVYEVVDDGSKVETPAGHGNVYVNASDIAKVENTTEIPTNHDNVYVNANDVDKDSSANVCNNSGPVSIALSDLKAMVKAKMLNEAKAFEDEYASLPSGAIHEHNIGMLTANRMKNRFKSTFPYDHSRVILDKLDNDPHSDYINANYIDSVTLPAEYIATQGPTDKIVDDLWRMIWQLKSGKIVMLTNLIEGTKKKCAKYWPDEGEPMSTKHFNIVLDRERVYAFYVIRDIILTEKKTKSVRQIHQFHYTTWPDHGTPDPNELVVFHRRVKHYKNTLTGKMVVHCSAGIGRTGTFIALDALLEHGKTSGMVDVMGYIRTMRKDRVNMVQTCDQYIAIHNLLVEAFAMPDTLIPSMKYHTTLRSLCNDAPVNLTKLWREYKVTQELKPTYTQSDFKTAVLPTNRNKNRDPNVLAVDKFRPYLTSASSGRTNYINAVAVPSYTSRTGYIVTQTPLEDTVVDLMTMIMDHSCDTIVIIENDHVKWLPEEGKGITIGSFQLTHEGGSSVLANIDLMDVAISNQDQRYDARVRVFHMTGWDRHVSVPPDVPGLLQLLEQVDSRRKSNGSKKTVVMCRDGYSQSGLFCCISNARDQMKIDEEVDMFQISRQLLFRRPEFITNYKHKYQCCNNVIKAYLDITDVYMN
ncbi:Receptor-type tyrosine-protein phosphatase mu [Mizuhopecten yessoensis]|uniref:protein-tyrosine-phosphatase n=1 Tax=Mizuhopecten yessoensis TaxID=6573 RepID=A0A210Q022_MIZYE|nr:Receptor-type tyrosine-protein phosphatase mu [Mizuhopecten yessoensis]